MAQLHHACGEASSSSRTGAFEEADNSLDAGRDRRPFGEVIAARDVAFSSLADSCGRGPPRRPSPGQWTDRRPLAYTNLLRWRDLRPHGSRPVRQPLVNPV